MGDIPGDVIAREPNTLRAPNGDWLFA